MARKLALNTDNKVARLEEEYIPDITFEFLRAISLAEQVGYTVSEFPQNLITDSTITNIKIDNIKKEVIIWHAENGQQNP